MRYQMEVKRHFFLFGIHVTSSYHLITTSGILITYKLSKMNFIYFVFNEDRNNKEMNSRENESLRYSVRKFHFHLRHRKCNIPPLSACESWRRRFERVHYDDGINKINHNRVSKLSLHFLYIASPAKLINNCGLITWLLTMAA
jgi:hypothetical protein